MYFTNKTLFSNTFFGAAVARVARLAAGAGTSLARDAKYKDEEAEGKLQDVDAKPQSTELCKGWKAHASHHADSNK